MNYLAHLLLAGDDPALRLGGILGDFVKGPLPGNLPASVARGVALHRRVDSFADSHPAFQASRRRVSNARRRYAGVMVDMFYDHLLAANWSTWCRQPLDRFATDAYDLLEMNSRVLPERLAAILPKMRAQDWLASYREIDAIARALDGMSKHRLRQPNELVGAGRELEREYSGFAADFAEFFPDAIALVQDWITAAGVSAGLAVNQDGGAHSRLRTTTIQAKDDRFTSSRD